MSQDLNRRNAIAGLAAIATTAFPAISLAGSTNADKELFAIYAKWQQGKALEQSFGAEHTAMERRAKAAEPLPPTALLEPIQYEGKTLEPGSRLGWTVEELSLLRPANYRELQALRLAHEKVRDEVWAEANAGQDRFDEIVAANTDLIMEMAETPANTIQGLMAKCHVAQTEGLFIYHMDFSAFAQSLVEDIQRLAPQMKQEA